MCVSEILKDGFNQLKKLMLIHHEICVLKNQLIKDILNIDLSILL